MILSHKAGTPSFGRLNSYYTAKHFFKDLPMTIDLYLYLSNWKLLYERSNSTITSLPNKNEFNNILRTIDNLLKYATNILSE
jgi:hypothetical protein